MRIDLIRIIVANAIALINVVLLLYSLLIKDKSAYLKPLNISTGLQIISYLVGGYYSGVAANVFSIFRNMYIEKSQTRSFWGIVAIVIAGGIISIAVNQITVGSTFLDYIPTISIMGYSLGMLLAKTASQMKIVNALDICLWIVFDYTHLLVVNVVIDFIVILSAIATQYVKLDTSEEALST